KRAAVTAGEGSARIGTADLRGTLPRVGRGASAAAPILWPRFVERGCLGPVPRGISPSHYTNATTKGTKVARRTTEESFVRPLCPAWFAFDFGGSLQCQHAIQPTRCSRC